MVKLHTTVGTIALELEAEKALITVENFLQYVQSGFYENTLFHRVIDKFMIQGGGYEPGFKLKPTKSKIPNEAANGLLNLKYTIAMARTSDPHSATAQFFINVSNNDFLNYTAPTHQGFGYCVFGIVTEGTEIFDKISMASTGARDGRQDVPLEDILIKSAELC
jgi:peptidyl-prolyl cis-trans isomerase B (cyclophilin B)